MDILSKQNSKNIRITFIEDVLGTCSGNPEIHDVAPAHSESLPAGTTLEITIDVAPVLYKGVKADEALREILDYGSLNGIGQWRNSGKGRFAWEEISG